MWQTGDYRFSLGAFDVITDFYPTMPISDYTSAIWAPLLCRPCAGITLKLGEVLETVG